MSTVKPEAIGVQLLTISDSRQPEDDRSGKLMRERIDNSGFKLAGHEIIREDRGKITTAVTRHLRRTDLRAIISSGGTGLSRRDITLEEISPLFDRELPGFGELFRTLSYPQVGARCLLSRATAGQVDNKIIFLLPGAPAAVELALDELILPVLQHMIEVIDQE